MTPTRERKSAQDRQAGPDADSLSAARADFMSRRNVPRHRCGLMAAIYFQESSS